MNWVLLSFFVAVAGLLALFFWSLYRPKNGSPGDPASWNGEQSLRSHSPHIPQMRRLFSHEDIVFLESRNLPRVAKEARAERRRAAILYAEAVRGDFRMLFQMGRSLAALSPEVAGRQEGERFWLALRFEWRYQVVRAMLHLHASPVLQLERMTELAGILSRRLDAAMAELGERAVSALEAASAPERRRLDLV
jgi:hypothetical protein